MEGINSYINGLDLSVLKEHCVHHGRVTQYAKGDLLVNCYFCTQKAQYEYRYHWSHLRYW